MIKKTALKHLEVLAVIHDSSSDGDGLLSELQEVGGLLWVLKEELNCRKQINNEHLKVKIFWLGNAKSRSDCLLTRSLQSDILLSILESDTRLGKRLREKLKPKEKKLEEVSLSDWNRVSRKLTRNSPDTSWGNALGEGGYGIVLGATKYSPAEIIDLAIKLSVCRNEHYYNVSAWRELNSMVHAKSKSDGNFLKLIDCFVSGNTRLTAALILCRVNDEVIVSALGMERLHQTILPILETACLSYQNQSKDGLETFRNVCREMIGQLYIFNNKVHLAHRDIKPCNVMTSEINQSSPLRVRLVDFGQVQKRDPTLVYQKMGSTGVGPSFSQGVAFCPSSFPDRAQIRSIGSGTPGYYCTAKQADGKPTESFESAVSSRDQYGLAMTLLHGVIPNFKATSFSKNGAPKDVDDFCKTLKLLLPGGSEVEYLTCMPCRRLVDLVFNLLFTPEFDLEKALYSAFILEPELSLDEESDLSKGIVIRCINHETGLPCKPLILMKFKGKGYVVFQYCAYIDGEIVGYYAGRYIPQSYSRRECIDIRAASVHVLCLRDNNSGDILVGDISHATPLSTYTSHGKILSFAQSSIEDDRKPFGTLKKPSIHTEEIKKVNLDDGTEFGFIPMRAYKTAEGLQLSTWRYPWGIAAGGKSVYSVEEEEKLAADASEAIADEVLENLKEKFR